MAQVNLMLKNVSGDTLNLELIDQYGGNFSDTLDADSSRNFSLNEGSDITVNGSVRFQVSLDMEGQELEV